MSMLAERRRKQKWAVDPRNTAWSNDDSKFGQRMLEKMGWSKGKGLGAQEQGATDHIKVQVKNNHLGLGATNNNEDNWIAHQDDFNQLLAELSTHHGQETADSSEHKEKKSFSLEEKSKISKNRVHYKKFTKGKDLSSRSKTDLDCIFGKRQSKKTAEEDGSAPTPDGSESSTTTTSAFTIQEYFAKRMSQLKNKLQTPAPGPGFSETPVERKKGKKTTEETAGIDTEHDPQPKVKRSKKKRLEEESQGPVAKRKDPGERQPGDPSVEAADCAQHSDDQDAVPKPRKKSAKKKPPEPPEVVVDAVLDDAPGRKKKKKKKASR
ncbi:PIN2/TERF1-interacting telomerase inhibitor 1 [Perognathus longimembris pacificus]|uniref:PIN2/TERF1-interacting telomerase inhibitor 1 n=1 Tax=Perognathus longimembris pacificus TaxID=214514 RepID=UPI002018E0D7|nr:PIN2/TERF1-interacting telomerase inhibitor 1 [Perognathus longimembris pacificus]